MCDSIVIIIIFIESSDSDNDEIKDECVSCGESANLFCQDCKPIGAKNATIFGINILNENGMKCRYDNYATIKFY